MHAPYQRVHACPAKILLREKIKPIHGYRKFLGISCRRNSIDYRQIFKKVGVHTLPESDSLFKK